ncbi:MAG TPA: PfkB family carbohydrate kinase [Terriglobales bacterium]
MRIVSIGEIIWDVIGRTEYLGGAPLNFAAHAHRLGHEVYLLSAVGDDERGRRALDGLRKCGISTDLVQEVAGKRTGTAEVDLGPDGKPMFRIIRPAAYDFIDLSAAVIRRIVEVQPNWIYFGTLFHNSGIALQATLRLLEHLPGAKKLYDVNLRDGNWNLTTVEQLASQATIIKLSDSEAEFLDASLADEGPEASVEHFCRRWSEQYHCKTICVTFGERGCGIYQQARYTEVPGRKVNVVDTIGAGDAFAAAFLHGVEQQWDAYRCGAFANTVGALVASRPGATPEWQVEEVVSMVGKQVAEP